MTPRYVFHLSVPVSDLAESERFYTEALGAVIGRRDPSWIDALLWGHQITLQLRPGEVLPRERQGKRHFGVILPWREWESLATSLEKRGTRFLSKPEVLLGGSEEEQAKFYLEDPSHNVIEVKAYRSLGSTVGYRDAAHEHAPGDSGSPASREFVHSRLIDAPQARVFRALAEPAHLARWWGPNGFSSTFEVFEFRPGGIWRFVLHGPDGTDYPNENLFREIVAPQRVIIEHLSATHHFLLTITFTAQGNQTLVGWRQVFDTAEHRQKVAKAVLEANEQNLSRLAAEVRNVE
jgi:extradiol dioxygenase family protein/uncharacterized protein YndB with AHSA1/START domain